MPDGSAISTFSVSGSAGRGVGQFSTILLLVVLSVIPNVWAQPIVLSESVSNDRALLISAGYHVEDDYTEQTAILRFQTQLGLLETGKLDAETRAYLTRVARGDLPCPVWSDPKLAVPAVPERARQFVIRLRGNDIAEQLATVQTRIEKCHQPFLYQSTDKETDAGIYFYKPGQSSPDVMPAMKLPDGYEPLHAYQRALTLGDLVPAYSIHIDDTSRILVELNKNGNGRNPEGIIQYPDENKQRELCVAMRLEADCLEGADISPLYGFVGSVVEIIDYRADAVVPEAVLVGEIDRLQAARLARDLAETVILRQRLDDSPYATRPRYEVAGGGQNQIQSGQKPPVVTAGITIPVEDECGHEFLEKEGRIGDQEFADYLTRVLTNFWRLLTVRHFESPMKLIGNPTEEEDRVAVVVVDSYTPADNSELLNRIGPASFLHLRDLNHPQSIQIPLIEDQITKESFNFSLAQKDEHAISHTLFAANVIGGTLQGKPIGAKPKAGGAIGTGAADASVMLATRVDFWKNNFTDTLGFIEEKLMETSGTESLPSNVQKIISFIYEEEHEACPIDTTSLSSDYVKLESALGGYDADQLPLFIVSAPQITEVSRCRYLNNTAPYYLRNALNALRNNQMGNTPYPGLDAADSKDLRQIKRWRPLWNVNHDELLGISEELVECVGFHCMGKHDNVLVVAALSESSDTREIRPRIDSRMAYHPYRSFLAPGTNIVAGDRRPEGNGTPEDSFGLQCGTSFSGPVVSGVAAAVITERRQVNSSNIKKWLAATVSVPAGENGIIRDLVLAGISHGIVNYEKALESDPDRYTVWYQSQRDREFYDEILYRRRVRVQSNGEVRVRVTGDEYEIRRNAKRGATLTARDIRDDAVALIRDPKATSPEFIQIYKLPHYMMQPAATPVTIRFGLLQGQREAKYLGFRCPDSVQYAEDYNRGYGCLKFTREVRDESGRVTGEIPEYRPIEDIDHIVMRLER